DETFHSSLASVRRYRLRSGTQPSNIHFDSVGWLCCDSWNEPSSKHRHILYTPWARWAKGLDLYMPNVSTLRIYFGVDPEQSITEALEGLPKYCSDSFQEHSKGCWSGEFPISCSVAPEMAEG